jgi:hypothetical protein
MSTGTARAADVKSSGATGTTKMRALTLLVALAVAMALWGIVRAVGVPLEVPQGPGGPPLVINPLMVVLTVVLPGLVGWAILAALERFTARARLIWLSGALIVLAVSLVPLVMPGPALDTRIGLGIMHLAVPAVVIPGFLGALPGLNRR